MGNTLNQLYPHGRTHQRVITIGRAKENDIQISDPKVSRFHCRIEDTGKGIFIRDLKSKNGTNLNGADLKNQELSSGDVLKIGDTVFSFSPPDQQSLPQVERTAEFTPKPNRPIPQIPHQQHGQRQQISPHRPQHRSPDRHEPELRPETTADHEAYRAKEKKKPLPGNFLNKVKIPQQIKGNWKIYSISLGLVCLTLVGLGAKTLIGSKDTTTPAAAEIQPEKKMEVAQSAPAKDVSDEERTRANEIAREANIFLETRDFSTAIKIYNSALELDPENILAKDGIRKAHGYVDEMVDICFTRGERQLKEFDYQGAIREFETVILLLSDRPDQERFSEANKLMQQAQLKLAR